MSSSQEVFEFGRIGSPGHWLTVGLVGVALAGAVFLLYRRDLRGRAMWIALPLLSLRLLAIALVVWIALDPRIVVETTVTRFPKVAVLVDASLSMETPDGSDTATGSARPTRFAELQQTINRELVSGWSRGREVEFFRFGKELKPISPESLQSDAPTDAETRLGSSIIDVLGSTNQRRPAAIILATDGGLNRGATLEETNSAVKDAKVPVHSIVFGSERPPFNLRVAELQLPTRAFRGSDDAVGSATVEIAGSEEKFELIIEARNLDGRPATRTLGKKPISLAPGNSSATIPISFPVSDVGRWEVTARIEVRPGEFRTDDNRAVAVVEVVARKSKVLLISGASGREYQFLRSVLFRDKTVDLSVLLQPGRQGVSQDAATLLTKFPGERAELFAYDAVVAIDPDWRLFDEQSLRNLSDWVASQSGGLVLVAGPSFWTKLGPDSPIVALSPVVPRKSVLETSNSASTELHPIAFTPEGESMRALALGDDSNSSKKAWTDFAGVFWSAAVERLKPGARLLTSAFDPQPPGSRPSTGVPLIATQFFGSGRVVYLGSGEFWRLRRIDERFHEQLWTQLVRYVGEGRLTRGSRRGGFLFDDRRIPVGNDLPIRAFVLDQQFQPLRAPQLTVSATTTKGVQEVKLEPVVGQPGRFQGLLPTPPAGAVKLQLPLTGGGVLEESLSVRESRLELDDVRVRRDVLERLAQASGGKVFSPEKAHELASLLPSQAESSVLTSPPRPLWDREWVVALMVALLAAEWVIRKLVRLA